MAKSLFPLKFPPGFFRNGTTYMTKGRWFDGTLVRWFEGALQAIGGWSALLDNSDVAVTVDQPIRGMLGWKSDLGVSQLAMGTFCKAFAYSVGVLTEITPDGGVTCGGADAIVFDGGAYGEGIYGAGPYGGVISDTRAQIVEANSWAFDTFGEELVAVSFADGTMFDWDLNIVNNLEPILNAPSANALVVTSERFLVALGANGDRRLVAWSDQDNRTVWTALSTNQAGDFPMPGAGDLLAGRRGRNETLIWSETDLWVMRFIGGELIYRFVQVGTNCGAISRMCMGALQSRHYWMGRRAFYFYDGFVKEIPSDVGDFVFNDFNTVQRSKVVCITSAEYGEVTWYYPSANSSENDRYVTLNVNQGVWYFGQLIRTAGVDRGAHQNPIYADINGAGDVAALQEHEKGTDYQSLVPFAETGPIEIGDGDNVMTVLGLIPDEKSLGDVTAILHFKNYPTDVGTEVTIATLNGQTDIRATGRTVRLRLTQAQPNWRVGVMRLDVAPGGRR